MGTIVEVHHDEKGIRWPKSVAPFLVHLVTLRAKEKEAQERMVETGEALYRELTDADVDVLWDDRAEASPGEKFADADLLGLPLRLVVSEKTLREDAVEWKERHEQEGALVRIRDVSERVVAFCADV
jgi:prolyl-tRNA synthetase